MQDRAYIQLTWSRWIHQKCRAWRTGREITIWRQFSSNCEGTDVIPLAKYPLTATPSGIWLYHNTRSCNSLRKARPFSYGTGIWTVFGICNTRPICHWCSSERLSNVFIKLRKKRSSIIFCTGPESIALQTIMLESAALSTPMNSRQKYLLTIQDWQALAILPSIILGAGGPRNFGGAIRHS